MLNLRSVLGGVVVCCSASAFGQPFQLEQVGLFGATYEPFGNASASFGPGFAVNNRRSVARSIAGQTLIGYTPKFTPSRAFNGVDAFIHKKGDSTHRVGLQGPSYLDVDGRSFSAPYSVDQFGNAVGTSYLLQGTRLFSGTHKEHIWIYNAASRAVYRAGPSGTVNVNGVQGV